jgi:hypothetical protein
VGELFPTLMDIRRVGRLLWYYDYEENKVKSGLIFSDTF